jgi:tight adherence protein B
VVPMLLALHAHTQLRRRATGFLDLVDRGPAPESVDGGSPAGRWTAPFAGRRSTVLVGVAAVVALVSVALGWTIGLLAAVLLLATAAWLTLGTGDLRDRLEAQLVPALRMMADSLDSGYSVPQALQRVAHDSPPPISTEFAGLMAAVELGTSLPDALDRLAKRIGSEDFEFFATMVAMQYRIGGDLSGLLANLAAHIQERQQVKAEVHALTAQARYSGWVLTALPFAVIGLLALVSPTYLAPLLTTTTGQSLVMFAAALLCVGLASIRAISRIQM